jgi:hypothetical protein
VLRFLWEFFLRVFVTKSEQHFRRAQLDETQLSTFGVNSTCEPGFHAECRAVFGFRNGYTPI